MITLTKRQKDILQFFVENKEIHIIEDLAKLFNVSQRTIRYDISTINDFLKEKIIGKSIQNYKNKGLIFKLDADDYLILKECLTSIKIRYLNQNERVLAIQLLLFTKIKTFDDLAQWCLVSNKTIMNDFPLVEKEFSSKNILVQKTSGKGITLQGDEISIRNYFMNLLNNTDFEMKENILDEVIEKEYIENAKSLINYVSDNLNQRYIITKDFIYNLAFVLYRISNNYRLRNEEILAIEKEINVNKNLKLINLIQTLVKDNEAIYICSLFLRTKLYMSATPDELRVETEAGNMAHYLFEELKTLMQLDIADEKFLQQLELHLTVAIYRMRNNINIENKLLEQIKISIPLLYEFTKEKIHAYEEIINLRFEDNEIAYIAMHIAAMFEMNTRLEFILNVLIVCSFGLATSSILKGRITQLVPECNYIGPLSETEAIDFMRNHDVDLIITTHDFDCGTNTPIVKVNPLLGLEDVNVIKSSLIPLVYKKSANHFNKLYRAYKNEERVLLKDYVDIKDIQVIDEMTDWKQVIQLAAKPLLDDRKLEQRYIDKMIEAVIKLGNYMILAPETAFVHAGSDDGINESCTSVLVLKNPVMFGYKNPELVRNIIVLGMKSKEENSMLKMINIFGIEENLELLKSKNIDVETIYNLSC